MPAFIRFLPILQLFLRKVGTSLDQFGVARFVQGPTFLHFSASLEKSGSVGRPTLPDFFLRPIDFFAHFTA